MCKAKRITGSKTKPCNIVSLINIREPELDKLGSGRSPRGYHYLPFTSLLPPRDHHSLVIAKFAAKPKLKQSLYQLPRTHFMRLLRQTIAISLHLFRDSSMTGFGFSNEEEWTHINLSIPGLSNLLNRSSFAWNLL